MTTSIRPLDRWIFQTARPFVDTNKNGKFDAWWMFNTGRAVSGVHDPIEARCLALRQDATTWVHCALDVGGAMVNEVQALRLERLCPPGLFDA